MVLNKSYSVIGSANMKFLVLVFGQLLVVHTAWSAVFVGNYSHPDYPGKCYHNSDPPTILGPSEEVTIKGECIKVSCWGDSYMQIYSCPSAIVEKGYEVPANHSLPYPKCCPLLSRS